MKKIFLFGTVALSFLIIASCGKDKAKPTGDPVEYKIGDADNAITKITYTDASGNTNVVNTINDFNGGDTTIYVTTKPFIAHMAIEVNNLNPVTHNYILAIFDSGVVKKYQNFSVPPNATSSTAITDTIN